MTQKLFAILCLSAVLVGCQGRVIWDDQGKIDQATENREVWDSKGKMDAGERKIWTDREGNDIIK